MKHLNKKIVETAFKKSQMYGYLLDQEKGLHGVPDLPEFELSLKPEEYQLPETNAAWDREKWEIPDQTLKEHLIDSKVSSTGRPENKSSCGIHYEVKKYVVSLMTSCDASSVPDHYVSDLTAKIRAQLQQEMDEKLDQKVLKMMQKLSDQNPNLKLKLDDSKQSSEMSTW